MRINFNGDFKTFFTIKQVLYDQYKQDWSYQINNSPKLYYYSKFKTNFGFAEYLTKIHSFKLRSCLTRFRLSSHDLNIETGRYNNIPRENRLCTVCNMNSIETEYYFIMCCPSYSCIRNKYFPAFRSFPNVQKFIAIMSKSKNMYYLIELHLGGKCYPK